MLFNKEQILNFMPHRDPFQFLDSVESITFPEGVVIDKNHPDTKDLIGTVVSARYKVLPEMEVLRGHFPGNPVVPGVVQVEMMAQAACMFFLHTYPDLATKKINVALLAVDAARFRKPALPGMDLQIDAKLTKVRGPVMSFDCKILCNGESVSEASILATVKFE